MANTKAWKAGESGQALVEFSLLALLLVPVLLYATFLAELSLAKLKSQEAARYMVWEMTAFGLSDWKKGDHDARFESAKRVLLQEMQARYADDLQSATPALLADSAPRPITLTMSFAQDQAGLANVDPGLWKVEIAGANTAPVGEGANSLFRRFGFNTKGQVNGLLKVHIKNRYLGRVMPVFHREKMLLADELDLEVHESLIADPWDLKDGADVATTSQGGCKDDSDYCLQVQRMYLGSLTQEFARLKDGALDRLLGGGFHNPLHAVVASKQMTGEGDQREPANRFRARLELEVPELEGHTIMKNEYTNVFKDTYENDSKSTYEKAYRKRGKYFLGCKDAQRQEGACRYRSGS